MRYRGNNICPDQRTKRTDSRKRTAFADIVWWRKHKKLFIFSRHFMSSSRTANEEVTKCRCRRD